MMDTPQKVQAARDQIDLWLLKGFTGASQILKQRLDDPTPMSDKVIEGYQIVLKQLKDEFTPLLEKRGEPQKGT